MLKPRHIDIVNPKIRPIECRLNGLQCLRLIHLMDLRHIEHGLRPIDLLEIMNNLQNRRLGTVEVQACVWQKRIAPWRAEENDNEMIGRVPPRAHEVLITAVDELDRRAEVRDVAAR
jgi:hypothetical protein